MRYTWEEQPNSNESSSELIEYSDADWGGDISGYIFKLNGGAVSWRSKKQSCVALSTAEAEYVALSAAAREAINVVASELTTSNDQPIMIFEDNHSTLFFITCG